MEHNIVSLTDSYKLTHAPQYPKGTETVFSYFESRNGAKWDHTLFFGLQILLKEYLEGVVVTRERIAAAKALCDTHIGPGVFNEEGWTHILEKYNGRLPLRVRAVPEGTRVPVSNVLMTVENTDPKCWWLTNVIETLLVQTWYPSTVATQSYEMKQLIKRYLEETADNLEGLPFKLHDFGYRGSTSVESAGIGGAAHLVNFMGTDTIRGLEYVMAFYSSGLNMQVPGFSIPASEHSTITSWGEEGELDAMRNMLTTYPSGLVACVSDSWDVYRAAYQYWGEDLKDQILARDGVLVVRPDSGDPLDVVPRVMRILGERIGQSMNSKGYLMLDPHVRMIQGDGITFESLEGILEAVKQAGYSTDNIAFGSGGGLLQKVNRDTQYFAFKCSAIKVAGEWRDVYKNPVTDASKASKAGRLTLFRDKDGKYQTDTVGSWAKRGKSEDVMRTVFENGVVKVHHTFDEVRERSNA